MMTVAEAVQILELSPPVTRAELKRAYREAVMVWHPDRFETGTAMRTKAEARTYKINEAFALLSRLSDSAYPFRTAKESQPPRRQPEPSRSPGPAPVPEPPPQQPREAASSSSQTQEASKATQSTVVTAKHADALARWLFVFLMCAFILKIISDYKFNRDHMNAPVNHYKASAPLETGDRLLDENRRRIGGDDGSGTQNMPTMEISPAIPSATNIVGSETAGPMALPKATPEDESARLLREHRRRIEAADAAGNLNSSASSTKTESMGSTAGNGVGSAPVNAFTENAPIDDATTSARLVQAADHVAWLNERLKRAPLNDSLKQQYNDAFLSHRRWIQWERLSTTERAVALESGKQQYYAWQNRKNAAESGGDAILGLSLATAKQSLDLQSRLEPTLAKVKVFEKDADFVVISAGLTQKIVPGTKFDLRRNGVVVGRITIGHTIEESESVGDLDPRSVPAGVTIEAGDEVIKANYR